jgi:hypothetical protein
MSFAARSRIEPEILCHSFPSSELILANIRTLQYHDEVAARTDFFHGVVTRAFLLTQGCPEP